MPVRIALVHPSSRSGARYQLDGYCSQIQKGIFRWHPLDFLALSSAWSSVGALVTIIDGQASTAPDSLAQYDAVVSLVGSYGWYDHLPFLRKLAHVHPRVFLSGDIARHEPAYVFAALPEIAGIIPELSVPPALDDLSSLRATQALWRPGSHTMSVPGPADQFRLGIQDFHSWDHARYSVPFTKRWPVASVLTQVGCPYTCDYCMLSEYPAALRSYDELATELRQLRGQGAKQIYVRDATLNSTRAHLERVLDLLGHTGVPWNAFARIEGIGKWAPALARAGANVLQFGLDSPNAESLAKHKKQTHPMQVRESLSALRRAGIQTAGHFVLGLENDGGGPAIAAYARDIGLDWFTISPLTVRPGTAMWRQLNGLGRLEANVLEAEWLPHWRAQVAHAMFYSRKPDRMIHVMQNQWAILQRNKGWRSWSHGY